MKFRATVMIAAAVAVIIMITAFSGCDKTDPTGGGNETNFAPSAKVVVGSTPNTTNCASGASTCSISVGVQVEFNGSMSSDVNGSIKAYDWTWGDGNTDRTNTPTKTHTFSSASNPTFTVSLKVWDNGETANGSDCPATLPAFNVAPCTSSKSSTNSATVVVTVNGP